MIRLNKAQLKALQFLAEVEHAELSNKTGWGRDGNFVHRGSGLILIGLGLAEHYNRVIYTIRITPSGIEYLSASKDEEA